MKKFTLEQLTEGIRTRNLGSENKHLVEKWSRTGLLRGLEGVGRENMSRLLENQAAELLREFNSLSTGGAANTSSGDLRGFTNIAFPIVRRVFGGLVSNELVSVQPMSLPSGLLFYLDYTYGNNVGGNVGPNGSNIGDSSGVANVYGRGQSIYNNPAGRGVQSGSLAAGGMYDLVGTGFTRVHSGSGAVGRTAVTAIYSGSFNSSDALVNDTISSITDFTGSNAKMLGYDPQVAKDLELGNLDVAFLIQPTAHWTTAINGGDVDQLNQMAVMSVGSAVTTTANWGETYQAGNGIINLRRANRRGDFNTTSLKWTDDPMGGTHVMFALRLSDGGALPNIRQLGAGSITGSMVIGDTLNATANGTAGEASTLVIPSFESNFATDPSPVIPEIDIKVESVAVTAQTRKLRARWSPELAQDLNAYHSLDAEVELTQILSEQVALEIDREILGDLLNQANGANLYWSRSPGKFVNKETGAEINRTNSLTPGPAFTGTVREWYETLAETIIDAANTIHRKTLRGSANFVVTSPDVCTILEASVLYRPSYNIDGNGQVGSPFTMGAEKVGTLSNRFTVYKDPYFPRNKLLVGYKGGSYLETGYVYAPYVPLIVTPTIFAPEDFTPRKGVMTRYGKKMVRSDFYGTVVVQDLNII